MKNLINSTDLLKDAQLIYSPINMHIGKHSTIYVKTKAFGSYNFDAYSDMEIKAHEPLHIIKISSYTKRNEYVDQQYSYITLFVRPINS